MLDLFLDIDNRNFDVACLADDDFTEKFWIDCLYTCRRVDFSDLPFKYQTEDFMNTARKIYPEIICKFPLIWTTKEEIIHALEINGLFLEFLDAYDTVFYEVACKQNGLAYDYVPEYAKTDELLQISEASRKEKKEIVRKNVITTNLAGYYSSDCIFNENRYYGYYSEIEIDNIPKEYVTKKFWSRYITECEDSTLLDVPEEFVTDELRCEYYEYNQNATFADLPKDKRTKEYCYDIYERNGDIRKLPFEFITKKEITETLEWDESQITYILEHVDQLRGISPSEIFAVADFDYIDILDIPPKYVTEAVVEQAMKNDLSSVFKIFEVKEQYSNINFVSHFERACSLSRNILNQIPDEYKNYTMCLNAVTLDPCALFFVPEKFRDEKLYKIVYTQLEAEKKDLDRKSAVKFVEILPDFPVFVACTALKQYKEVGCTKKEKALTAKITDGKWLTIEKAKNTLQRDPKSINFLVSLREYYPEIDFLELLEIVCSSDGMCLKNIPIKFYSKNLYHSAINNTVFAADFILPEHVDDELWAYVQKCLSEQQKKANTRKKMRRFFELSQRLCEKFKRY